MSKKCFYLLGLLISSNCLLAQDYELNPFIDLNKSICEYPDKHLTFQSSGFFEYIGAGDKKVFDCGNDTRKGDVGCQEEPELICRSENSKRILSRSESLLSTATTFINENPKFKDKRKIQNAIKLLSKNMGLWNSAKNTIDFIPSVERESIFVGSLLPNNIFQEINSELKKNHETRRASLLAEIKRKKEEEAKKAREIAQQKAAVKKAEEEKLAAEKALRSKQIKNYVIGIFALIIGLSIIGSIRNRKIIAQQKRQAEIEEEEERKLEARRKEKRLKEQEEKNKWQKIEQEARQKELEKQRRLDKIKQEEIQKELEEKRQAEIEEEEEERKLEARRKEKRLKEQEEKKKLQKIEQEARRKEFEEKREQARKEEAERAKKRQEVLDKLRSISSDEVWNSFKNKKVCIGMHIDLVQNLKGNKYEEKRKVTADKTTLKYKYGRSKNSRGNWSYKMEITFENNLVIAFKDL